jgi:RNA polymerase sigma factor (TIGR02999 family)
MTEEHPGSSRPLTQTLLEIRSADRDVEARKLLFAAVYDELRGLARGLMRRERPEHTLRPTALVHEAYVRLIDQDRVDWTNQAHFLAVAARAMREILVDYARGRSAQKRGQGLRKVTLTDAVGAESDFDVAILDLHSALDNLERLDGRVARVVELRTFGGLTAQETAHALGFSKRTVDDDWRVGRMWLGRELAGSNA